MRAQCAYITYIPWASCAAMFWIICEFTRFLLAKTKRVRRLFQYVLYLPPPERHIPSAWAKYCKTFLASRAQFILRCKITKKKWHLQIKVPFFCIFIAFRLITLYDGATLRAVLCLYVFLLFQSARKHRSERDDDISPQAGVITFYSIILRLFAPFWRNQTTFCRGLWDLRL